MSAYSYSPLLMQARSWAPMHQPLHWLGAPLRLWTALQSQYEVIFHIAALHSICLARRGVLHTNTELIT